MVPHFAIREMRKHSFNHLLIILSCFDLAFIICGVPVHSSPVFGIEGWLYAKLYQYVFYPLTSVSFTGSIYMTLAITIERYVAVCKPHRYRELNIRMNAFKRVLIYTIPVASFSVLLNIPKFFETQVSYSNETGMVYDVTEHRLTPNYIWWYTLSFLFHPTLTLTIIPVLTLVIFNYQIYKGIRKARTNVQSSNRHGEMNLAAVLVSICSVFVVCHALRLYLGLQAVFLLNTTFSCMKHKKYWIPESWLLCLESASHLLVMISSSSNFIIYCTISTKFKIFIKRRFLYRSRPHSSCNDHTFNSQSQLRTLGPAMNNLTMRRPSGCQEIFRMAVQQAHTPPIPRPPEICINELNGHVRFTKQDPYLAPTSSYLNANGDVSGSCQTLETSSGTRNCCDRSNEMEASFNAGNTVDILLESISLSNVESNNKAPSIEDQKETLSQNFQSSKTNNHGPTPSVQETDFLMPTENGRRHGRNSWTPEYALSDSKYAVRYRSTGNIFNLREYSVVDGTSEEEEIKTEERKYITECKSCCIRRKDNDTSLSCEDTKLQIPTVILSSTDANSKNSKSLDACTKTYMNGNVPSNLLPENIMDKNTISSSLNNNKPLMILIRTYANINQLVKKTNGTSVTHLKFFNLPKLLAKEKYSLRKRHSIPHKKAKQIKQANNNREISSECSGGIIGEKGELSNGLTISPINDKDYPLMSIVNTMQTSFVGKEHQNIGCCGVLTSNEVIISSNICPEKEIGEEIGHLPGQMWPHVMRRQNSMIHRPNKDISRLPLLEVHSRRNSTAICGLPSTSRRSTNSTTATLSSLTPTSSKVQSTSSDEESRPSSSNFECPISNSRSQPEDTDPDEIYHTNWNNLWFNEEVQI